jgi:hypothetical protein
MVNLISMRPGFRNISALNILHDFRQGCALAKNFSPKRPAIFDSHHFPIVFSKKVALSLQPIRPARGFSSSTLLPGVRAASGMATSSLL